MVFDTVWVQIPLAAPAKKTVMNYDSSLAKKIFKIFLGFFFGFLLLFGFNLTYQCLNQECFFQDAQIHLVIKNECPQPNKKEIGYQKEFRAAFPGLISVFYFFSDFILENSLFFEKEYQWEKDCSF